jgi:hypothetical protein
MPLTEPHGPYRLSTVKNWCGGYLDGDALVACLTR